MVNEADGIRQDKLLIERSRNVFPNIYRGRGAVVKINSPFIWRGGKESNAARVYLIVFQGSNIRVPIHSQRRLASIICLAGTGRIALVARRSTIRHAWIADTGHRRLQLEIDCS